MDILHKFPYEIQDNFDIGITLSDGIRLSARIWRPIDSETNPVPAILEYIPYRKRDGTIGRDELIHPYVAGHGYATVRVDMRGNGDSEGVMLDEYTETELNDAVEVIEWLAAQPWCNGNVGMMGKSWGAFNSLQTAALAPAALKAVVAVCGTTDRYADDIHYKGGCLMNDNLRWGSVMLAFSARPPDPLIVGDKWRDMWRERLEAEPFLSEIWLSHQNRDDYWKHGSVCEDYSKIKAAILMVGGWADGYINALPHLMKNATAPIKAIAGPWGHQYPHIAAPAPQIGFLQEMLRWWDHWLKDNDNGVADDPLYRYWLNDSVKPKHSYIERDGCWLTENQYPSPKWQNNSLYLHNNQNLSKEPSDVHAKINSPADCGFGVGEYFPMATAGVTIPELAGDQRDDDTRSAIFDTAPLTADTAIVGRTELEITLSSSSPQSQICIRLCDVHPDGSVTKICHGFLNLAHRDSFEHPKKLIVGQQYTVTIQLDETAYNLPKGHKLRLAVSNQYWPFLWPNADIHALTIHQGQLKFFTINDRLENEYQFEKPVSSPPWDAQCLRESSYNRHLHKDYATGAKTLNIISDSGSYQDTQHGLCTESITKEIWNIHPDDPLCASGEIQWQQHLQRDNWNINIVSLTKMTSDKNNFFLEATLIAYENDQEFFRKSYNKSIPKDHH